LGSNRRVRILEFRRTTANRAPEKDEPMTTEHSKLAYTIDEAVSVSGLGRTSLYVAASDGRLPFRKNGKRTLILADDLRKFLASLPVASTNVAA
jgi:excisionase family DNA binding protein